MARERKLTKKKAIEGVRTAGILKLLGRSVSDVVKKSMRSPKISPTKEGKLEVDRSMRPSGEPGRVVATPKRTLNPTLGGTQVRDQISTPISDLDTKAEQVKRLIPRKTGPGQKRFKFKKSVPGSKTTGKSFRRSQIEGLRFEAQKALRGGNLVGPQTPVPAETIRKRLKTIRKQRKALQN